MKLQKISAKAKRGKKNDWIHFCYVPDDIKMKFDINVNTEMLTANHWLSLWAKRDFGDIPLETTKDMDELKNLIRAKYKELYPEIYIDSATDNQGWLRVWFTKNMERELNEIGKL